MLLWFGLVPAFLTFQAGSTVTGTRGKPFDLKGLGGLMGANVFHGALGLCRWIKPAGKSTWNNNQQKTQIYITLK